MFSLSKAADLNRLVQGGQLYLAITFSKGSLVLLSIQSIYSVLPKTPVSFCHQVAAWILEMFVNFYSLIKTHKCNNPGQNIWYGISTTFLSPTASGRGGTITLNLGMMKHVFYHCAGQNEALELSSFMFVLHYFRTIEFYLITLAVFKKLFFRYKLRMGVLS